MNKLQVMVEDIQPRQARTHKERSAACMLHVRVRACGTANLTR